jgi:hypothetical protein
MAGVAQHLSPRSLVAKVVQSRPAFTTLNPPHSPEQGRQSACHRREPVGSLPSQFSKPPVGGDRRHVHLTVNAQQDLSPPPGALDNKWGSQSTDSRRWQEDFRPIRGF